jgi:hypothetical protein
MSNETAPLIEYFKGYIPLSKKEIEVLNERFIERRIRRKQFVLQEMKFASIIPSLFPAV